MRRVFLLISSAAILAVAGQRIASARTEPKSWVRIARDANYDVDIDSSRIEVGRDWVFGVPHRVYSEWYRTDHKLPRLHREKPFNREVVHSLVLCDSLWFKVLSVDMYFGDHLVARQQTTERELSDQPWRRVARGTTEEIAARAACFYGARRAGSIAAVPR